MKQIKAPLWAVIALHLIAFVFIGFGIYDKEIWGVVCGGVVITAFWIGTLTQK